MVSYKMELLEKLENVKKALESVRPEIDDLNRKLNEMIELAESADLELSIDVEDGLAELHDFYRKLPVWDTINTMIEYTQKLIDELEK